MEVCFRGAEGCVCVWVCVKVFQPSVLPGVGISEGHELDVLVIIMAPEESSAGSVFPRSLCEI